MTNILVTGGAGYIGSHTCKALAAEGYQPVVLDNLSTGHEWAVKWGPLVVGNVGDEAVVRRVAKEYNIQAAVHFAASSNVGESVTNPRAYFENNSVNTLKMLGALLDNGVNKMVFSSTCATYGDPRRIPLDETHGQLPVNPYGDSKLFVEKALRWYGSSYDLRSIALRYFNASGADPEGEIGEDHTPETHLIPLVIRAANGSNPLRVFGTDYPTADGTAIRDYIHVCDLAAAHILALKKLLSGGGSDAFNLGTGRGNSVLEVIRSVERVGGKNVPANMQPRRAGDPAELVADNSKALSVLGWRPDFVELDDVVRTAWAWHEKHDPAPAAAR